MQQMNRAEFEALSKRQRRRLMLYAMTRAGLATVVVLLGYYLIPLDRIPDDTLVVTLLVAIVAFAVFVGWEISRVLRANTPALTAVEALATTVPLFITFFAAVYYSMANNAVGNFNVESLTRTDCLYFTVTVFATVGFGDITATSQTARALVTVQMVLDLIVVGLVIRVFYGAVQEAWKSRADMSLGEAKDAIADAAADDPAT